MQEGAQRGKQVYKSIKGHKDTGTQGRKDTRTQGHKRDDQSSDAGRDALARR